MAEQFLFKDVFHRGNINHLAVGLRREYSPFKEGQFMDFIFDNFEKLSLSERNQRICEALKEFLPSDYLTCLKVLRSTFGDVASLDSPSHYDSFIYMPQAHFVASYGLEFFDESMVFLYDLTRRFSSEFAVRAFILHNSDRTLKRLESWVDDPCPHVRRWISEGTRPRLPWGIQLKQFVNDPRPVIALLSKLKGANERYVEKSIANNLNDIAKDHPNLVVETLKTWKKEGWRNEWLKKHALRTLLKSGDQEALALLGFCAKGINASDIGLVSDRLKLGESLEFSFELYSKKKVKVMVDFIVHHVKASGQLSPKVFKLSQCEFIGQKTFQKKHSIKKITTRKYYSGKHLLEIQVNGEVLQQCEFYLDCNS